MDRRLLVTTRQHGVEDTLCDICELMEVVIDWEVGGGEGAWVIREGRKRIRRTERSAPPSYVSEASTQRERCPLLTYVPPVPEQERAEAPVRNEEVRTGRRSERPTPNIPPKRTSERPEPTINTINIPLGDLRFYDKANGVSRR